MIEIEMTKIQRLPIMALTQPTHPTPTFPRHSYQMINFWKYREVEYTILRFGGVALPFF